MKHPRRFLPTAAALALLSCAAPPAPLDIALGDPPPSPGAPEPGQAPQAAEGLVRFRLEALAGYRVAARDLASPDAAPLPTVTTDAQGRFSLRLPPGGAWQVRATAPGAALEAVVFSGTDAPVILDEESTALAPTAAALASLALQAPEGAREAALREVRSALDPAREALRASLAASPAGANMVVTGAPDAAARASLLAATVGLLKLRQAAAAALAALAPLWSAGGGAARTLPLAGTGLEAWLDREGRPLLLANPATGRLAVPTDAAAVASVIALPGGGRSARGPVLPPELSIPLAGGSKPLGIAVDAGSVWVSNRGLDTASRLDPVTATLVGSPVSVGTDPRTVAIGEGGVWVANNGSNDVTRIDPTTGTAVATIPVGAAPRGVTTGAGAVWVANQNSNTVSRIDPSTNTVAALIPVGATPRGIAFGMGFVWVANNSSNTVSKIDPATNAVVTTIAVGSAPYGVACGEGGVWVTNSNANTVSRIDPGTGTVMATIPVGDHPFGVATGGGRVWVANYGVVSVDDGSVSEIDPATDTVADTHAVGLDPWGVAVGAGAVWITNENGDAVIRLAL